MNFIKPYLILTCFLILISCSKEAEIVVQYKLAVSANPTVGGTITPGSSSYNKGQIVNLLATPSAEYVFKDWSVSLSGSTNPSPLTMDMDKSVVGNFEKRQYPLSLTIEGQGTVKEEIAVVAPQSQYPSGTTVKLTATPNTGWNFSNWSGDLSGNTNPETIKIDKNKNITVVFKQVPDKDGDGVPDDKDLDNNTRKGAPVDANGVMLNPIYLDKNGVTIKAYDWAIVGDKGLIKNKEIVIINRELLLEKIKTTGDLTTVCTSKITDLSNIFYKNTNPIYKVDNWDVSNVKNMAYMFASSYFDNDISNWDVSKVTDLSFMFYDSIFNQDISSWNVGNVTNLSNLFRKSLFNKDISKWNVGRVINMEGIFAESRFNGNISNWEVKSVTNIAQIFSISIFNGDLSKWEVSSVTNMSEAFQSSIFNGDISNWNVSKVTQMNRAFRNSKFNGNLSKWDVSNVIDMSSMFDMAIFNNDISNWNVSKVQNMEYLFWQSRFNKDISRWDVRNVTNMQSMFLMSIINSDISNWDVSKVRNMTNMFAYNNVFNQNLSKWNVKLVNQCRFFSHENTSWTLPKPNFTNCTP
jgi:surface protein